MSKLIWEGGNSRYIGLRKLCSSHCHGICESMKASCLYWTCSVVNCETSELLAQGNKFKVGCNVESNFSFYFKEKYICNGTLTLDIKPGSHDLDHHQHKPYEKISTAYIKERYLQML